MLIGLAGRRSGKEELFRSSGVGGPFVLMDLEGKG